MDESEGVQVNIEEVLEVTQNKLREATSQNILLEALANQQQKEIAQLRATIDKIGENNGGK